MADAERLVRWWETTYFKARPELFARRLSASGLDRSSVVRLLAERNADPGADGSVLDGIPCPLSPLPCPLPAAPAPPEGDRDLTAAFVGVQAWAWSQVKVAAEAVERDVPDLTVDLGRLERMFTTELGHRLSAIGLQTLIFRLHRARKLGLRGATPADRFQEWARTELEAADGLAALVEEFPALGRALADTAAQMAAVWQETMSHLAADWAAVRDALGQPSGPDRLVGMVGGLGDTHNGGRTVIRLHFERGPDVIYKPRPMAVDAHFQELIGWIAARGLASPPRTVTVVDRSDHGWMEAVTAAPCRTAAEVESYFRRLGVLLLLLYVVDGTDMHSENLIAAGEHPVLVDLETLFQAGPASVSQDSSAIAGRGAPSRISSCRRSCFPRRRHPATRSTSADCRTWPDRWRPACRSSPGWRRTTYAFPAERFEMPGHDNVARFDGAAMRATDHVDAIVAGFVEAYELVVAHRTELTAPDGLLQRCRHDRVRHLFRETAHYALLLRASYHPSCLRDAVHRDFVFDALWLETIHKPHVERLIPSERLDLLAGDVPYFSASVGDCDVVDSRGRVLSGFLATSGLDHVLARVAAMGPADLTRQVACIRGSLGISGTAAPGLAPPPFEGRPDREASTEELLGAAVAVGERLADLAVVDGDRAHWAGPVPLATSGFKYTLIGADLYAGKAGIALFLAYLDRVTGGRRFRDLARAAFAAAADEFRTPELGASIGAFAGIPGLLYTGLHLASLWDDDEVLTATLPLLETVDAMVASDQDYDVLSGAAGCVLVMLRLAKRVPSSGALALAERCGKHLLAYAERQRQGVGWRTAGASGPPLVGLSHGAGGVAWALQELAGATGDAAFAAGAEEALSYERSHFHLDRGNWADLRRGDSDTPAFMWAWCHGAPGVAVSRLAMGGDHGGGGAEEIAVALASTAAHGFGGAHTLCHGDLGNADMLLLHGERSGDPFWQGAARRRAHAVLEDRRRIGAWRCNAADMVESPSLMTGLAGIGYELLRLAHPQLVPSVLALEAPR